MTDEKRNLGKELLEMIKEATDEQLLIMYGVMMGALVTSK